MQPRMMERTGLSIRQLAEGGLLLLLGGVLADTEILEGVIREIKKSPSPPGISLDNGNK